MFSVLFEDGSLQDYIGQNAKDPWVNTPFEGYVHMSPKQKGEFGERFVSKFFKDVLLCDVKRAKSSTSGHDRIIDSILTEIKFSLATRDKNGGVTTDSFIINHVSKDKEILHDPTVSPQMRRHIEGELHDLEEYAEHHKKEIEAGDHHDPSYLELFCDQFPSEPECLIYDD